MKAALFLMLYQQLWTERANHLYKHCSVGFSTTHSTAAGEGGADPCGQQDGDTGRRAHGAVTLDNGIPQLSTALTQFMWAALAEQPVLQSVSRSRALQHL
ncbi:unnamed protein product [Pleuronectes platessa]|uniref:Uncharacterized protein n=1 Tax=Pleuronectes platessa TaxID=8262 RepID=A0A9N7ZB33_PLEPL|nr:unnamed protein product [Pleuronectes platessa]